MIHYATISFATYMAKLLHTINPDLVLNKKAEMMMDKLIKIIIRTLIGNNKSITHKDISFAATTLFVGEIKMRALSSIAAAIIQFTCSIQDIDVKKHNRRSTSGLVISVSKIEALMGAYSACETKDKMASIAMTALVEYICYEILDISSVSYQKKTISSTRIKTSVSNDNELAHFFKNTIPRHITFKSIYLSVIRKIRVSKSCRTTPSITMCVHA